ncbi:MAG: sigma 54-interacting transcriptional regulator, partial [Acidobacteriota bacterium]
MAFRLIIDSGGRRRRHVLPDGDTVAGSAPECQLVIPHPTISRRHAVFTVDGDGALRVRDLGSSNGTWVESRRIDGEARLALGTTLSLGSVELRVEAVGEGDLEVGLRIVGGDPAGQVEGDPATEGPSAITAGLRTTLPSTFLQRFTFEVLPAMLAWIERREDVGQLARALGAAVSDIFPCSALDIRRRRGATEAVLFTRRAELPTAARVRDVEMRDGDLVVAASFFPPEMGRAYGPVVDLTLRLLRLASSESGAAGPPPVAPPPRVPEPPSLEKAVQTIYRQAGRIAKARISVLIRGESGTGKEVLARYLHAAADRRGAPFVALNCAALPRDLLEVELFGIEERVATGVDARAGKFEQANGGTLFLDEIGDMPLATQAKILRVLQEQEIYRVGGDRPRSTDAQVLAATNRDLDAMVREGSFRGDLYHRLAGWVVQLPPLRERRADIPQLAAHFLAQQANKLGRSVAGRSRSAGDALMAYRWAG